MNVHVCIITSTVHILITNIITNTKVRIITSPCSPVLQPVLMTQKW